MLKLLALPYISLMEARISLIHYADWVLANGMQLAAECPRTLPPEQKKNEVEGERQQGTRALMCGILAFALHQRLGGTTPGEKINYSRIAKAALKEVEKYGGLRVLGHSTMHKGITEGIAQLFRDSLE